MDPRIVVISGPLQGQVFRLADGRVSIGRDPSNRLPIPDGTVSRHHCVIDFMKGKAEVADLESHNGTFVDNIPVSKRELQHGNVVRVGTCELLFLTGEDSPPEQPRVLFGNDGSTEILKTVRLLDSSVWSSSPSDVGRMARDLNALVKISHTINSIRDPEALQQSMLECIFEVVPADAGAILILGQPDEEPSSVEALSRR